MRTALWLLSRLVWWLLWWPACTTSGADSPHTSELGREHAGELELVCFAEIRSGAIERFPFADKTTAMHGWLDQRLADARVRAFYFEELPQVGVEQQDDHLRDVAARAGIARCPLADYLEFTGKLPREGFHFDDCVAACAARHAAAGAVETACRRGCGG